ncbi:MAG: response regulator [Pseudomonadota bacterium]
MKKHALVIDNDFFFVEFLSDILEKRGYVVSKAYDGKDGISRLREAPVDLMFVDMIMPKIDGKQVIQFTRKQFAEHRFPIIAISGIMIEGNEEIQKIGADYYIAKGPIETMADHISRFLDKFEKQSISTSDEIMETTRLLPRHSTPELVEILDFHKGFFSSIGLGLFVIDRDEQIIRANDLGLSMINKSMEAMLNSHVTTLLPESKKIELITALKSVTENRNRKSVSFEVDTDDLHLRVIVSIHRIEQEAIGWIIAMEDMRQWEEPV